MNERQCKRKTTKQIHSPIENQEKSRTFALFWMSKCSSGDGGRWWHIIHLLKYMNNHQARGTSKKGKSDGSCMRFYAG